MGAQGLQFPSLKQGPQEALTLLQGLHGDRRAGHYHTVSTGCLLSPFPWDRYSKAGRCDLGGGLSSRNTPTSAERTTWGRGACPAAPFWVVGAA